MTISEDERALRLKLEMFIRNIIPPGREWLLIMPLPGDDETIWQAGAANSQGRALAILIMAAYGTVQHLNEGDGLYHPEA